MKEPQTTKVLIVDDDAVLRDAIAFEVQRRGYQATIAASGNAAFKITQSQSIDIVISDIRMPDGDGVTLLKNLRAVDPVNPVVILVTGFSDYSAEDLLKMGARQIFSKPFDRGQLVAALDGVIGYARQKK